MFHINFVEKIKTNILCLVTTSKIVSFMKKKMWKNTVEPERPQMTTERKRISCWVPAAIHTHTHGICNAHCFSTAAMVARPRLRVMFHAHCLSCFCFHSRLHRRWRGNNENTSKPFRGNSQLEEHLHCLHYERIRFPTFLFITRCEACAWMYWLQSKVILQGVHLKTEPRDTANYYACARARACV